MWPTRTFRSLHDFSSWVARQAEVAGLFYRGQANDVAHGRLVPTVDRNRPDSMSYEDCRTEETRLIDTFAERAAGFLGTLERDYLQRVPPTDKVIRMTVMQHFGAPTRLLDWTQCAAVAAFFASIDESNRDGAIWWFDAARLEQRLEGGWERFGFSKPNDIDLNERIFSDDVPEFVCPVYLRIPFRRAEAQRSVFTIGSRLGLRHDDVLPRFLPDGDSFGRAVIPAGIKRVVVEYLHRSGVDAVSLQHAGADRVGSKMSTELRT